MLDTVASRLLPDRVPLTKAALPRLVCPNGSSEKFFWDSELSGFGIRALASGRRRWIVQYRDEASRTRRMSIGDVRVLDPAQARAMAKTLLAKAATGENPSTQRQAKRQTMRCGELFDAYLQRVMDTQRPSSVDNNRRNLLKYGAPLAHEPVEDIDRATLYELHQRIGKDVGHTSANRVLSSISACWVWGMRTGLITVQSNPASYVPRFTEVERERVLSMEELELIWRCVDTPRQADRLLRLIILTACRRREVGGVQWSEINGDLWVIPKERMKNGYEHEVYLSDFAKELLLASGGPYLFGREGEAPYNGWARAKTRLDDAIAIMRAQKAGVGAGAPASELAPFYLAPWGLHDIRRTFSTVLHDKRAAEPHVIESCLAHAGIQTGIGGVYNRARYWDAKREAWLAWEKIVREVVGE